ncbi:MAG TPA: hypothetical protein VMK65_02520, partial [Longimicrobiales bacterium]|nr:hypothetical protein [Longimicrobiales bacterium]
MPVTALRLPGIHFETVRPSAPLALPRMDVAAFAGFAARGPVGIPVEVQDVVRFAQVFGEDLALAWDPERGEMAHAHLPLAVREFFRNGGRRCWVLRLAREPESARFRLPGLLRSREGEVTGAAWAVASSPGSWADGVRAHATLLRTGVPAAAVVVDPTVDFTDPAQARLRLLRPDGGELLRLELADGTIGFFPPAPLRLQPDATPRERDVEGLRPVRLSTWFRPALPRALPKRNAATLDLLDGAETRRMTLHRWSTGTVARFQVPLDEVTDIHPGAWLRLDLPVHPNSRFRPEVYLIVDEVDRSGRRAVLLARRGWRGLVRARAWDRARRRSFQAALMAAELWARRAGAGTARVADVGLIPAQPRWFGHFPDDARLFAPAEPLVEPPPPALWAELSRPRFPLAAPATAGADAEVLLPLGLEALPREEHEQPALTSELSALERDGLAALGSDLFLDRDLATVPTARLLEEAFQIRYGAEPTRPLTGLHALMEVEEASLLALPDAVQPGWRLAEGALRTPPPAPEPPEITDATGPDEEGV